MRKRSERAVELEMAHKVCCAIAAPPLGIRSLCTGAKHMLPTFTRVLPLILFVPGVLLSRWRVAGGGWTHEPEGLRDSSGAEAAGRGLTTNLGYAVDLPQVVASRTCDRCRFRSLARDSRHRMPSNPNLKGFGDTPSLASSRSFSASRPPGSASRTAFAGSSMSSSVTPVRDDNKVNSIHSPVWHWRGRHAAVELYSMTLLYTTTLQAKQLRRLVYEHPVVARGTTRMYVDQRRSCL